MRWRAGGSERGELIIDAVEMHHFDFLGLMENRSSQNLE
jgi:hypothetical protein